MATRVDTTPERLAALEAAAHLVLDFVSAARAAGGGEAPPATDEQIEAMLGRHHQSELRTIQSSVASQYGLDVGRILSTDRRPECVRPRHVAMYLCRRLTACTYAELARSFRRDHSSVVTAVDGIERDPARRGEADRVGAIVRAGLQRRGGGTVLDAVCG